MIRSQEPVLILYNEPGTLPAQAVGLCAEADVGVLDEVRAVEEVLSLAAVPCRSVGVRTLCDVSLVATRAPEAVVFNLVESLNGAPEDMAVVPAVCRAAGKAVTGNGERPQLLCLDKQMTKVVLAAAGLAVPDGVCVRPGDPAPALSGRVIVKPLHSDASEGIDDAAVIDGRDAHALAERIAYVHRHFGQAALVERYIDGREINVSVVQLPDGVRVMPLAEIAFVGYAADAPRIVGYAAKWDASSHAFHHTPRHIPADLPLPVAQRVRHAARRAWDVLGCSGYARVDFRLADDGTPYILEVNPNPDICPDAGFAAALAAGGVSYPNFVGAMLEVAAQGVNAVGRCGEGAVVEAEEVAGLRILRTVPAHRAAILDLVRNTGFFRAHEIDVAAEVLDAALVAGPAGDYQSFTALDHGEPVGWVCYGHAPCTASTWDVYWLAVAAHRQKQGIGRRTMAFAERRIAEAGGTLAVVETSGRPDYAPTRTFYERLGYELAAEIPEFYGPGDAKLILTRRLGPPLA